MSRKLKPKIGEIFTDHSGRKFTVSDVKIGDRLGREVVGRITGCLEWNGERWVRTRRKYNFSTTLEMWRETWRDKRAPIPIGRMKIG